MTVYVDEPIWPFHGMIMCHMAADEPEELHAMAAKIGLKREWFQETSRVPHCDLCKSKRAIAIKAGAIEIGSRKFILHFWRER